MFGNMDFSKLGEMLGDVQEKARQMEEDSKNKTFTVKAGGGMIKLSANGAGEVSDLDIDDSLLEDKDSLQILLISAINDVFKMVEENKKNALMGMAGGLDLGAFGKNDG